MAVCIVATGPLTSDNLVSGHRAAHPVESSLFLCMPISPIVDAESINMQVAFRASRYDKGGDDYLNCPMDEPTYQEFYPGAPDAEKVQPKAFEQIPDDL